MTYSLKNGLRLLICLAFAIYALAATHALALYFAWYWVYPWFDVLTHFWGGACVALGAIWFSRFSRYTPAFLRPLSTRAVVLLSLAVVGVLWEVYELSVQIAFSLPSPPNYLADTALDLVMDVIGGIFGYGLFRLVEARASRREEQTAAE